MSLFVCENCQTIDNTALTLYWSVKKKLCSACERGKWHGAFKREKFNPKKWKYYDGKFVQRNPTPTTRGEHRETSVRP